MLFLQICCSLCWQLNDGIYILLHFSPEYYNSRQNIIILFWKYLVDIRSEAWLNLFWEYINWKFFAVLNVWNNYPYFFALLSCELCMRAILHPLPRSLMYSIVIGTEGRVGLVVPLCYVVWHFAEPYWMSVPRITYKYIEYKTAKYLDCMYDELLWTTWNVLTFINFINHMKSVGCCCYKQI